MGIDSCGLHTLCAGSITMLHVGFMAVQLASRWTAMGRNRSRLLDSDSPDTRLLTPAMRPCSKLHARSQHAADLAAREGEREIAQHAMPVIAVLDAREFQ